ALRVDVFATNQRARSYARLGVDDATLRAARRDLIWLGITGFGPDHDEAAYDPILQARAGFMELTGEPDGPPTAFGLPMVDLADAPHLERELGKRFAGLATEEALALLQDAGVPVARVNTLADVVADPLVAPRLQRVTDPRTGLAVVLPAPPASDPPPLAFPPRLGEHN